MQPNPGHYVHAVDTARVTDGIGEKKRVSQVADSEGWRYRFNPAADVDKESMKDRTSDARHRRTENAWDKSSWSTKASHALLT
mmetsp:Transcript_45570/g.114023  ORF Transcript_45570/g.114023 Transcript_45570/m.114023 type:complete len:83 (+) Transcript_45570:162-410(+)